MKSRLHKIYMEKAVPELKERFNLENNAQVPRIEKVNLNVGYGKNSKDSAFIENVDSTLQAITGQKPIHNKAKKSISNFKIREGALIGASVTLRGKRMYDFLDKLISVTLPRVRDFRGISPTSFDKQGNYTLGIKENIAFPEINSEAVEKIHGLEVTISTTAKNKEQGLALLDLLGFPFRKK